MRQKISRLSLEVVVRQIQQTTTSNELPSVEEEKQLRDLVDAKASLEVIMGKLHKSVDAVQKKCVRLGLEVDGDAKKIKASSTSSSGLKLPAELPSVEEALKDLVKVKAPIDVIAGKLSRKPDDVIIKCKRLKLDVVVAKGYTTTTIKLILFCFMFW